MPHPRMSCWLPLLGALALLLSLLPAGRDLPVRAAHTASIGALVVTGVAAGNSSAKVQYQAYPGSADYRIYDQANPGRVKYSGTVYNGSAMVPSTTVEWNTLDDDLPHTLIVQAVDQLGPVPRANQYDVNNHALLPGGMLGGNSGATSDGLTSINGQGPYTDTVHIIAQSQPFVVQANRAYQALPSSPDATGVQFDTFDNTEGQPIRTGVNAGAMTETWSLNNSWDIRGFGIDTDPATSMPFLADGHAMDVVFDGGGPGNSNPLHTQYGSISYVPRQTIDLSGGQMAHLTAEVDQHVDGRRWWQWYVLPHGDLFTGNNINAAPLNADNIGFAAQLTKGGCTVDEYTGGAGAPTLVRIAGAVGQSQHTCTDTVGAYGQGNGQGLDNRSRVDLFLTRSTYALFADGQLVSTQAISPPLPAEMATSDVYFSHYLYHSDLDHQNLKQFAPYETYWINQFPYSDERHWQAMGVETLPASDVPTGSWAALASRVQPPAFSPPVFAPPTATPTSTATATNTPTDTPTSTETAVPTDTPTATATDTPLPTDTATDTAAATPEDTSTATDTQTPIPSDTPTPTATASETATSTPVPTDTATDTGTPTSTSTPRSWKVETIITNPAGTAVSDVTSPFAG